MDKTLKALHFLATPFLDDFLKGHQGSPPPTQDAESLLHSLVSTVHTLLEEPSLGVSMSLNSGPPTAAWTLTSTILHLLLRLQTQVIQAESVQPPSQSSIQILSLQGSRDFSACVELLIGFGLLPYLLPGVGVPPKVRKGSSAAAALTFFLVPDTQLPPLIQFHRLAGVVDGLLELSSQNPSISSLIIPRHVSDLLAALLQIVCSPLAPPTLDPETARPGALSQEEHAHVVALRERFQSTHLTNFLTSDLVPKADLVSSLFLIGQRPKWMAEGCGRLIQRELLAPGGLLLISSTLLLESSPANVWSIAKIVGNLMRTSLKTTPTSGLEKDQGQHPTPTLEGLCSQCLQMISPRVYRRMIQEKDSPRHQVSQDCGGVAGNSKELTRIGFFCSLVLMDIDCSLTQGKIFHHLFDPLLRLNHDNPGSIPISDLIEIVAVGEGLLSLILPTGSSVPLEVFQPLWSLLWTVYVTSVTYLEKRKVQEPVVAQMASLLKQKIGGVVLLLLEILGAGSGDKLDIGGGQKPVPGSGSGLNVSQDAAKSLCEFCISLLFVTDKVDLDLDPCVTPLTLEFQVATSASGLESVQMAKALSNSQGDSSSFFFQTLADSSSIFCSLLHQEKERLSSISSSLFRQLLAHHQNHPETGQKLPKNLENVPSKNENSISLTSLEPLGTGEPLNLGSVRKFISLKLLESLGMDEGVVGASLHSPDYKETLSIVELVLGRLVSQLEETEGTGDPYAFTQSIIFALGLLGTIVETGISLVQSQKDTSPGPGISPGLSPGEKADDEFWTELLRFLPALSRIRSSTDLRLSNLGIPVMAESISNSISTRGACDSDRSRVNPPISELTSALEAVGSPLLPLKGHGLLQLRRLIEAKDPETLAREGDLLPLFQAELGHEDSYIYLMAIQGLAAMGLRFHARVIPIILEEWGTAGDRHLTRSEVIEVKMKIGEVLVRVIQRLGALAPLYRVPLTNALFGGMRDDEPMIRASALANLGELCHLLKFSLGTILTEVWASVESILSCEKDLHVRRAALHLLVLLLKGVEKDYEASDLLGDVQIGGYLRDVRRLLSRIQDSESDPVSRTHAQLALTELELIVKKLLSSREDGELAYKIRVLGQIQ